MSEERLNRYGAWLIANEGKKGTPEFDQVAEAYRALRSPPQQSQPDAQPPAPQEQPQGAWETIKSGARSFVGAADDIARIGLDTMSLGAMDHLAGYLSGRGVEAERADTEAARQRAGHAGTAASVIGSLAPSGLAVKAGAGLTKMAAPSIASAAQKGLTGLGLRTAGMATVGAGMGAGEAVVKGDDAAHGAIVGALSGAAGNLAGEAVSAGVSKVAGAFNRKPNIPGIDDLRSAKDAAYAKADQSGVIYTPGAVDRINTKVAQELAGIGYDPALQPGASVAVKRLMELQGQNVTLTGLDTVRKIASNGFIPGNKSNNLAVSKVIAAIDDAVTAPRGADVLTGNATSAADALKEARGLASRVSKFERVFEGVNKAELRAASTGSGGNVDNATRQNIRQILEKPRGFTPDEREALRTVVEGTPAQNVARVIGKLSPTGNGLMAALGLGATATNPAMVAGPAIGMVAKALADRGTTKSVDALQDIIRAGGSRSAAQAAPNALQRLAEAERLRIARILMGIGLAPGVPKPN